MALCPFVLSRVKLFTLHQILLSLFLNHGKFNRLVSPIAASTLVCLLWSSIMVYVDIGVVVVSLWECSCPTFGCGFLITLELSIENHWLKLVVWYWKPPWPNEEKCRKCIRETSNRRLGQSSNIRVVSSCDGVIVMIMFTIYHRAGVTRRSMVVINKSISKETRRMLRQQNNLKIWLYRFQNKRISMPWIITTKHVISCSGSVWDGLRCNRWIASNDLFIEKRHLFIRIESHKKDLERPKTKWRKASESAYPTNALGSIVLLLSLLKVHLNNMFDVIFDSCNMLH
ncbi:unnamed protein product [Eruca vesicaria subsp. sativa]|uniref:Uncharacterized protein n=1 Tax=Eruca vesicaria subsp. sativa TaxID=29727 RepID=A0ABC8LXQ3_ERUVS|nr:unnamed protein product [Eruca vesicaria subsp. sativa]